LLEQLTRAVVVVVVVMLTVQAALAVELAALVLLLFAMLIHLPLRLPQQVHLLLLFLAATEYINGLLQVRLHFKD
jgi:hypothetical protein